MRKCKIGIVGFGTVGSGIYKILSSEVDSHPILKEIEIAKIAVKNLNKDVLEFHIAHNEGNYFCTKDQLKEIKDNNQIAIYYCNSEGKIEDQYNPNGSIKNIAGIFNKEKNVLGMMPHPERMIDQSLSGEDGSIFFKNLINNIK